MVWPGASMPDGVRKSFTDALRDWWPEYSYPMRIHALAEPVAAAVPECVGRLNRWKTAVVEQRVSLAHGINSGGNRTDSLVKMHALNLSIRWMLLVRLLLLTGVTPQLLNAATHASELFGRERDVWQTHWPGVFASV